MGNLPNQFQHDASAAWVEGKLVYDPGSGPQRFTMELVRQSPWIYVDGLDLTVKADNGTWYYRIVGLIKWPYVAVDLEEKSEAHATTPLETRQQLYARLR